MNIYIVALAGALGIAIGAVTPAAAQDVLTRHRLSAALASEAVTEAVATCAKQGYAVAATIIDTDGVTQAALRGDDAGLIAVITSYDKAYTVIMLGAARNEDSSAAIATRMGPTQPAGGVAKLDHVALQSGGFRIKLKDEAIAAIGVGGGPGPGIDDKCAQAGIDKISARLK